MTNPDPLYTEREAAEYLSLAPKTLRNWRSAGKGPDHVRVGSKVRYRRSALEAFIRTENTTH